MVCQILLFIRLTLEIMVELLVSFEKRYMKASVFIDGTEQVFYYPRIRNYLIIA